MRSPLHSIGVADYGPRKAWPVLDKTHCYNVPNERLIKIRIWQEIVHKESIQLLDA